MLNMMTIPESLKLLSRHVRTVKATMVMWFIYLASVYCFHNNNITNQITCFTTCLLRCTRVSFNCGFLRIACFNQFLNVFELTRVTFYFFTQGTPFHESASSGPLCIKIRKEVWWLYCKKNIVKKAYLCISPQWTNFHQIWYRRGLSHIHNFLLVQRFGFCSGQILSIPTLKRRGH